MDRTPDKPATPQQAEPAHPGKSDKETIRKRVDDVLRIMLDGAGFQDIVHYAAENGWNVGQRQLRNYVRRAHQEIERGTEKSRKKLFLFHVARRENLYARAVNIGDYRTALAVLHDLALLQGLYPDPRRDLLREVRELKRRLEEAEARRCGAAGSPPSADGKLPSLVEAVPTCRP
jgi:hypothetical protein